MNFLAVNKNNKRKNFEQFFDKNHNIDIIVDRLVVKNDIRNRLAESVETAMKHSENLVKIDFIGDTEQLFSGNYACPDCGISFEELTPRMFSFNNPMGACPECTGDNICIFVPSSCSKTLSTI